MYFFFEYFKYLLGTGTGTEEKNFNLKNRNRKKIDRFRNTDFLGQISVTYDKK